MAKPFKFRHVNEVAGGFVLAGGALLVGAVVLMGVGQGWFVPKAHYWIVLPPEGAEGLKAGADVSVQGNVAGTVRRTGRDKGRGQTWAEIVIDRDFSDDIGVRSEATIRRTLGFGDAYLEIRDPRSKVTGERLPRGEPLPPDDPNVRTIQAGSEKPPTAMVEAAVDDVRKTVADVRKEVIPALQEGQAAFGEYRQFAAELRRPGGSFQQALGHVNSVAEKVERGDGLAGKLLTDPQMAADAQRTLANVNKSLAELQAAVEDVHKTTAAVSGQTDETLRRTRAILTDIEKTTATLPETTKSINRTAEALPGLVLQLQETLRQVQRTVEGLQRSFLVRGSVAPDETPGRIRPEDVGAGGR